MVLASPSCKSVKDLPHRSLPEIAILKMHTTHSPKDVPAPPSRHAQAVETVPGLRWLHISGQIGLDAEGILPETPLGQHQQIWRNIVNLLKAAGMGPEHLVKVTAFVTNHEQILYYRQVRDEVLDGVEVASTLVIVAALARPEWVVEIDAVAAAP